MTPFHVIIPARYASTRYPGKVLERIDGKTLIEHVYRAARASGAAGSYIATDDDRVAAEARRFDAPVFMTGEHDSGSARIAEAARLIGLKDRDFIVNAQGDEPGIPPEAISRTAALLMEGGAHMSTLATPIADLDEVLSPHVVKVVRDQSGFALYFSRAPIPWPRDAFAASPRVLPEGAGYLRHIGIYGYRNDFLQRLTAAEPTTIETLESLEQLRALHMGGRIRVGMHHAALPPGVDVPDDLDRAAAHMSGSARPIRLLFVCMGNICRSPTAQGVAEKMILERGLSRRIEVDSAGTHAYHVGHPPDPRSIAAASKRGIDIRSQKARCLAPEDFDEFDHILVMDRRNLERVEPMAPPGARARVSKILDFAKIHGIDEVPDPYYGGRHGFEQVLDLLENAMTGLLDDIV